MTFFKPAVEPKSGDPCEAHADPRIAHRYGSYGVSLIRLVRSALGAGSLELIAGPPENVALAEAGRNGTRVQAVAKLEPGASTHRLRYRWHWKAGTDATV